MKTNPKMIQTTKQVLISDLYKQSGLLYIRFDAEIDVKPNGQQKIGGNRKKCCLQQAYITARLPKGRW